MTWIGIVRHRPDSKPWVAFVWQLSSLPKDFPAHRFEAVLSREDALGHPEYRDAVLAWDAGDRSVQDEAYREAGLDPDEPPEEIDWDAWRISLDKVASHRELVEGYWLHWKLTSHEGNRDDETFYWAWEEVQGLVERDAETVWPVLLDLIETAPSWYALAYVAAAVLEEIIIHHGDAFIDRIEEMDRRSTNFHNALTLVWMTRRPLDDVVVRIEQLRLRTD